MVTVSTYISENSFEYVWIDLQDCWKDRRAAGRPVGSAGTGPATIPDENLIPTWISSLLRLYHLIRGVRSQLGMCTSHIIYASISILFFPLVSNKSHSIPSATMVFNYRARICINPLPRNINPKIKARNNIARARARARVCVCVCVCVIFDTKISIY